MKINAIRQDMSKDAFIVEYMLAVARERKAAGDKRKIDLNKVTTEACRAWAALTGEKP